MRIGNLEVPGMLALAPMAGVTDLAFRTVCADLGADMTVTEMVSSRALVYQDKKSRLLLKKNEGSICGAQIFGNDPQIMAEAAVMAAEISGCDFIDINMGCPMPKIAGNGDGCGLMKNPDLAGQIVRAVSEADWGSVLSIYANPSISAHSLHRCAVPLPLRGRQEGALLC